MNKYDYFTQLRAIDFTNIDFAEIERMAKKYEHVYYGQNEFKMRIYKEVYLDNDKNSKNTFKYIDQFVNDVVQTKDTINGLKIHFEEDATYKEFIEVLIYLMNVKQNYIFWTTTQCTLLVEIGIRMLKNQKLIMMI